MKRFQKQSAFSVIELIVTVAIIVLLAGIFMPTMYSGKARRIKCVNNLKNMGLAARIYASDHGDQMPGSSLRSNSVPDSEVTALEYFVHASIELATPKLLYCPDDRAKKRADSFTNVSLENISYFASLTANQALPGAFFFGDRNLQNHGQPVPEATTFALTTNALLGWTKAIHNEQGNIAMGDGSVQQFSSSRLSQAVRDQNVATNLLLIP